MDKYKITDSEMNSGVVAAPDTLNDTPQNNKQIFDRLPKLIANKVNAFIDAVVAKFEGYYTKTETDEAINEKVKDMGAGDMSKAVYDTDNDGTVDKAYEADNVRGFWFAKEDADGNPTDEPYIHWMEG